MLDQVVRLVLVGRMEVLVNRAAVHPVLNPEPEVPKVRREPKVPEMEVRGCPVLPEQRGLWDLPEASRLAVKSESLASGTKRAGALRAQARPEESLKAERPE
jgi:hypothetical protein